MTSQGGRSPSGSVELLLACAGVRLSGPPPVLPPRVHWPDLIRLTEHHGMGPHVRGVLERSANVPESARSELRQIHRRAFEQGQLLSARLLQLLGAFNRAGIPVMTLEGPALAQQLYGDAGMRDSRELDLLVPSTHVERAAELLRQRGYWLEPRLRCLNLRDLAGRFTELRFRNERGVAVDLHWASAPVDYPCRIPEARLWSAQSSVAIGDQYVSVLSRECLLVYLCIHGTRHCWTQLRWLCDVALLAGDADTIAWDVVASIAAESNASRPVELGLRLIRDLLHVTLPATAAARLTADETVARLAGEVADRLLSAKPDAPTAVQRTNFSARIASTVRIAANVGRGLMTGQRSIS